MWAGRVWAERRKAFRVHGDVAHRVPTNGFEESRGREGVMEGDPVPDLKPRLGELAKHPREVGPEVCPAHRDLPGDVEPDGTQMGQACAEDDGRGLRIVADVP